MCSSFKRYKSHNDERVTKSDTPNTTHTQSILRDAVNDLALHFLAKMKIMVVTDIERSEVEFVCKVKKQRVRGGLKMLALTEMGM